MVVSLNGRRIVGLPFRTGRVLVVLLFCEHESKTLYFCCFESAEESVSVRFTKTGVELTSLFIVHVSTPIYCLRIWSTYRLFFIQ